MIKAKLMKQFKSKFGGEYTKDSGRWYWSNGSDKNLVTTSWLLKKLDESVSSLPEEPAQEFNTTPPELKEEVSDETTEIATQLSSEKPKKTTKKKKETEQQ